MAATASRVWTRRRSSALTTRSRPPKPAVGSTWSTNSRATATGTSERTVQRPCPRRSTRCQTAAAAT